MTTKQEIGSEALRSVELLANASHLRAEDIVSAVKKQRTNGDTELTAAEASAIAFLAQTAMKPHEIAGTVFFIRDGHKTGRELICVGPPGLLGTSLGDFVYDEESGAMEMVPFPGDIAHLQPLQALTLAIQLEYRRVGPGEWKDKANF